MLETLTHAVAVLLDDALGDLVSDVEFGDLVDAVLDGLTGVAATPAA